MNKISIIVPIYKAEKYIIQCVESIINQTYKNLEIILVDDGSPDNCNKICDEYAIKDTRIKVIHKVNGGLMSALKEGVKIATGEYIGFVDSDDYIELDMFQELYDCIIYNNADVVQCNMWRYDGVNKYKILDVRGERIITNNEIKECLIPQLLNFWEYKQLYVSPSRYNKLYKRNLVEDGIKFCDSNITYGEDLNLTLLIFLKSKKIVLIEKCLYHYRYNNQSITSTYKSKLGISNIYLANALKLIVQNEIQIVINSVNIYIDYLTFQEVKNELNSSHVFMFKWKEIKRISNIREISSEFYKGYLNNNEYFSDKIFVFLLKHRGYLPLTIFEYIRMLRNKSTEGKRSNE